MEKGEYPSLAEAGKVMRCKSENQEPIVAVSEEPRRATDCKFKVPDHQETCREKFSGSMSQPRRNQPVHRATDCTS